MIGPGCMRFMRGNRLMRNHSFKAESAGVDARVSHNPSHPHSFWRCRRCTLSCQLVCYFSYFSLQIPHADVSDLKQARCHRCYVQLPDTFISIKIFASVIHPLNRACPATFKPNRLHDKEHPKHLRNSILSSDPNFHHPIMCTLVSNLNVNSPPLATHHICPTSGTVLRAQGGSFHHSS